MGGIDKDIDVKSIEDLTRKLVDELDDPDIRKVFTLLVITLMKSTEAIRVLVSVCEKIESRITDVIGFSETIFIALNKKGILGLDDISDAAKMLAEKEEDSAIFKRSKLFLVKPKQKNKKTVDDTDK